MGGEGRGTARRGPDGAWLDEEDRRLYTEAEVMEGAGFGLLALPYASPRMVAYVPFRYRASARSPAGLVARSIAHCSSPTGNPLRRRHSEALYLPYVDAVQA